MRNACPWFSSRAVQAWKVLPGRSFMVLSPPGCNEIRAAGLVRDWCMEAMRPPVPFVGHTVIPISVTSDSVATSSQFAAAVVRSIRRGGVDLTTWEDPGYPSDTVLEIVEHCLMLGHYPVLFIERFHAFAQLADGGMTSVLSRMRSLEVSGRLTTVAFSSMTYESIRRRMDGSLAFLNSVYGDSHDLAVLDPISRQEFVSSATHRGVPEAKAQASFRLGGGPDVVFDEILSALCITHDLEAGSVSLAGRAQILDSFIGKLFDFEGADSVLDRLVLGGLNDHEIAHLRSLAASKFLLGVEASGRVCCSGPVLARWLVSRNCSGLSQHFRCLELLKDFQPDQAAALVRNISSFGSGGVLFRMLVQLHAALQIQADRQFFGIDWLAVRDSIHECGRDRVGLSTETVEWLSQISVWAGIACDLRSRGRLQVDLICSKASCPVHRQMVLFMVANLIASAERRCGVAEVAMMIKVPEIILQCIGVGFCGIDFNDWRLDRDDVEFEDYYFGIDVFRLPLNGSKLTLLPLTVIVPSMLVACGYDGCGALVSRDSLRAKQGRLVDWIRNPSSHTIVELNDRDKVFLIGACKEWLQSWAELEGGAGLEIIPGFLGRPTLEMLEGLLCNSAE